MAPIVEHLTERTKWWLYAKLKNKNSDSYLAQHVAFPIALVYAFMLTQLVGLSHWTHTVALLGLSVAWYELSHMWKKQKRDLIPIEEDSLEGFDKPKQGEKGLVLDPELMQKIMEGEKLTREEQKREDALAKHTDNI